MSRLDAYKRKIPTQAIADSFENGARWDDNNTLAFYRQLEEIEAQTYEITYADLKWRQFLPVKTISNAVDSWTYRYFDKSGTAIFMDDYSDDLPGVELKGYESTQKVKSIGVSYQYNFQEARQAAYLNMPLDSMKSGAARRAVEALLDRVAAVGDTPTGLYGLTTVPGVAAPTVAASSWAQLVANDAQNGTSLAPAKIAANVNSVINSMISSSFGKYTPDLCILPLATWVAVNSAPRSTIYTNDTIFQYIKAMNPGVEFQWWNRLNTAGTANGTRAVFMKKDPTVARMVMGQEFEILTPAIKNMAAVFPCHARTGGVQCMQPLGLQYLDGV